MMILPDPSSSIQTRLLRDDAALGQVLRRERSRANRMDGKFSLVSFAVAEETGGRLARTRRRVVHYLSKRSRCIDALGESKGNAVWLVLPDCHADDAGAIAQEVCERFSRDSTKLRPDVFHYDAVADAGRNRPLAAPDSWNDRSYRTGRTMILPDPSSSIQTRLLRDDAALGQVLCRERSRANRMDGKFSLVSFAVAEETGRRLARTTRRVVHYLSKRSRCIDALGESKGSAVWLVLPDCHADDAGAIAQEVCERFSRDSTKLRPDVFHYDAVADAGRNRPLAAPDSWNGDCGVPEGCCAEDRREADPPRRRRTRRAEFSARPMETLLVRSMPLWKRLFDLLFTAAILLLLLPVFLLVVLAIKVSSPGPVFFRQWRSGQGGVPFRIWKFRSMAVDAEAKQAALMSQNECDGPAFKIERDPRATPIGRILRQTSLDELPQLCNVLAGEMSIVGPRPLPCSETAACQSWQRERLDATPGVTCVWQAAKRRSTIPFAQWMRMDIRYIRARSLFVDFRIIAKTAVRVLCDAVSPAVTVLQRKASRLCLGPARGRRPDRRSPGDCRGGRRR